MPADQLFEDYDPDLEDVFGSKNTIAPKRVIVTEQQKNDPLRKPKVELQGILVAEKQPITAKDIERRMMDEYGQSIDPKKYGCNTMDDLLQACSDTIVHHRRRDGVHVYLARVSEANQDIVEMVQQQTKSESKRAPQNFLYSRKNKSYGNHGSSFRAYKGSRVSDDLNNAKGTPDQFKARSKLGPAKTLARLQNLADVLQEYRDEIGKPHHEDQNRITVTLGALVEKFKKLYGLPAWGKNMSESELYMQINVPEFAGVLEFWRLREDGDIFVENIVSETIDADTVQQKTEQTKIEPQKMSTPPEEPNEIVAASATPNRSINTPVQSSLPDKTVVSFDGFSSISDNSRNSSMLISEAQDDGFFESGPGFGGNLPPRQSNSLNTSAMTDIGQRFGTMAQQPESPTPQSLASSSLLQNGNRQNLSSGRNGLNSVGEDAVRVMASSVQPMRPTPSFGSRAIVPSDPLKVLVDYIKSRGYTSFEALPEDDKVIVNFYSNVFKVHAQQAGDMIVRLVDPTIDTSTLSWTGNSLREPVEADLRWMSEASFHVKRDRRRYVKPVMFVRPRGFLVVVSNEEEEEMEGDKMAAMEDLLRGAMVSTARELGRHTVKPGMAAVYIYRQGTEVRYYRVLILGKAHQEGDVMVLLVDHNEQYLADVQLSHLFELPAKISFKYYAPNVVFATLYGVMGLSEEEQDVMWKNVDDEERKKFIVGFFHGDKTKVLSIDMVWRGEMGHLEWLSQIAKRRGAILSSDTDSIHLKRSPLEAVESFGPESFMDFVDYLASHQSQEALMQTAQTHNSHEIKSEAGSVRSVQQATAIVTPTAHSSFGPRSLDLYALFDKYIEEQNLISIVGIVQFARSMKESFGNNSDWKDVVDYMTDIGRRNNIRL